MNAPRLLVVDDEANLREFLAVLCRGEGYTTDTADSMSEARHRLSTNGYDLVLCDVIMPDGSGLDLLREIKAGEARTAVVMMTAYTSTKSAIEAMRSGAHDYVSKPFDVEELKIILQKALETTALKAENVYLRRELERRYGFDNIIGNSPRMRAVFDLVERVARSQTTVLIHGESGTGKELIARAIHFAGPRQSKRFLSINCGAFPEGLLESELFGHERGAFTGAVREKKGLFQEAHGGTLFLDEIGEMTPAMQVKLLRAVQEKVIRKVGGTQEEVVDVRIVAATNQDIEALVARNAFREDLYYRISVIPIRLPPLRQRREDIPALVEFFMAKYDLESSASAGRQPRRVSLEAMKILEAYEWPGNVRELENVVQRTLALSTSETIAASDLPAHVRTRLRTATTPTELPADGVDIEGHLDAVRAQLMSQALERTGGNQTAAADLLHSSFRSFRYYAKKLGLATTPSED